MSVGGLYHYFPTKRALVLHGLSWSARDGLCRDYRERIVHLAGWNPEGYAEACLDNSIRMFAFVQPLEYRPHSKSAPESCRRPSTRAEDERRRAGGESLRQVVTEVPARDLEAHARALRRGSP